MSRTPTPIDQIADDYTLGLARLSPLSATEMGIPGYDDQLDDLSPDGHAARAEFARGTLARLAGAAAADETDAVTLAAMRERLELAIRLHDSGETLVDFNNIASPIQGLREVFDLMPTDTEQDWVNIAGRLNRLPEAFAGYIESLREGVRRGLAPARRQVDEALSQAQKLADRQSSFFATFAASAHPDGAESSSALASDLANGASAAQQAYGTLAAYLSGELATQARKADGFGRERYAPYSQLFIGAVVDLDETYEWGLAELERIRAEQAGLADAIAGPGASERDAVRVLNEDPARRVHGTDALRAWMQETADQAIAELGGKHFDIAEPIRRIECRIAPSSSGAIYYTGPSDDFSRPGRMWWSVPDGVNEFATWAEKTTVYHEGVPGHHLQIAQAVHNRDELNSWRRLVCWMSGHGEGWALYAERLMEEFGFLDDPGDRFGMLDGQRLRATRVVLDLGVHLGKKAPAEYGGGSWDADKAWDLLRRNVNMGEDFLRFELNRYLGWPGQAPSYKVGQRLWEQLREAARQAAAARGEEFSLKDFHTRALNQGSLPLDVLRATLVG